MGQASFGLVSPMDMGVDYSSFFGTLGCRLPEKYEWAYPLILLLFRPERLLLDLLPIVGAGSSLPFAHRHDDRLFVVCFPPLISMSVCPDKSNIALFGVEELASLGHWPLTPFCLSSTSIPVLPARGECKNTYPLDDQVSCIGVLKDWLVRALATSLATGQSELLLECIQECALPIAQCESMALEAAAGEQELHYTASRQQHLWALLGMKMDQEVIREPVQTLPGEDVQTLPGEATPHQQKSRVGEQQPVRLEVGEPQDKGSTENCPLSGTVVELQPARSERQEWRNSSVRRAEQPERRRFGANSFSIPLIRHCALHVRTKARCGSGKEQLGPNGSEERSVHAPLALCSPSCLRTRVFRNQNTSQRGRTYLRSSFRQHISVHQKPFPPSASLA